MLRMLSIFAICSLACAPARAQDDAGELPAAFSSDRPGFANTPAIAARERITTELGVLAAFGDPAQGMLPLLSLRAGIFDWLELRWRGPNAVASFEDEVRFGIDDPIAGFKIGGLLHETVSISSVWEVSIPIGTDGFGREEATWRADVQLEWRFWGPLSVTPNAVASIVLTTDETGATQRIFEGGGSLKVSWRILDVLTVFAQSYVLVSEVSRARVAIGGGIAWLALPNVQIDASFDASVTRQGIPPTVQAGTTILW
jgi:hypothetical protein